MHTVQGVEYSTNSKLKQGSLFHRGPGSARFLAKVVSQDLRGGLKVYLRYNTTHTVLVRKLLELAFPAVNQEVAVTRKSPTKPFYFGNYGFTQTVGLWLQEGQGVGRHYLAPFISVDSFEFTPEEYLELRERLEQTIRRNSRLPAVSTALEDLNTGFFRHQTLEESQTLITRYLQDFLEQAGNLKQRFLTAINQHARKSIFRQQRQLRQREEALQNILVTHRNAAHLNGRQARRKQQLLKDAWTEYCQQWLGEGDDVAPAVSPEALAQESQQLAEEREGINRELAAANLSLSHLTVDPELGDAAAFQALAEDLEKLVLDIDESGLYQLPLGGATAATTSRQLQRLELILQRLQNSHQHLAEFPDFYAHRHFWYAQPARLRRLLAPLQGLPAKDWTTAFASWYFDRCLEQYDRPAAQELQSAGLASWLESITPVPTPSQPVHLNPGDPLPPDADVLVDLTGEGPPADFTGRYLGLRPLTDHRARHHALAGVVNPRLVLQQTFVPVTPPSWKLVRADQPPPGAGNRLSVQLQEDTPWEHLTAWNAEPTEHLRLYLPQDFPDGDGEHFLQCFADILNSTQNLTVFHNWSPAVITQALLSDGLNPAFLMAALLRAAEACGEIPFVPDALMAVGREIRLRCGIADPAVHPLAERMRELLQERLPNYFYTLHQPWRDTFLPLVVLSPEGKKTVLLPGGRLPGNTDKYAEALRQRELTVAGLHCLEINAYACWEDADAEVDRLVDVLTQKDGK